MRANEILMDEKIFTTSYMEPSGYRAMVYQNIALDPFKRGESNAKN